MSEQRTFASLTWQAKGKVTRRERFLAEMDEANPWARLLALIEPHYPKAGNGEWAAFSSVAQSIGSRSSRGKNIARVSRSNSGSQARSLPKRRLGEGRNRLARWAERGAFNLEDLAQMPLNDYEINGETLG